MDRIRLFKMTAVLIFSALISLFCVCFRKIILLFETLLLPIFINSFSLHNVSFIINRIIGLLFRPLLYFYKAFLLLNPTIKYIFSVSLFLSNKSTDYFFDSMQYMLRKVLAVYYSKVLRYQICQQIDKMNDYQ